MAASAAVLGCWLPDTRVAGRRALPRTDNADAALAADSVADRGALCALSALLCLILPLLITGCWVSMRPVLSAGAWAGGMAALITLDGLVYVALPLAAHAAGAAPRCRARSRAPAGVELGLGLGLGLGLVTKEEMDSMLARWRDTPREIWGDMGRYGET